MEKFLRFWAGYVLMSVEGEQIERFLNLCRSRGISFRNLCCPDDRHLTGSLSVQHFFLLRPVRNKTKIHIRVLEKLRKEALGSFLFMYGFLTIVKNPAKIDVLWGNVLYQDLAEAGK